MSANNKWTPKLLPYQKQILQFLEKKYFALQPKQTLATMAEQQTSLCNSIPVNIAVFDRMVADGYKLNLITGQYEKAPRRSRSTH